MPMQAYIGTIEHSSTEEVERLHHLRTFAHAIGQELELQPLLEIILDQLKMFVDYQTATLKRLEDTSITLLAYRGPMPIACKEHILSAFEASPICVRIIAHKQAVLLDDIRSDDCASLIAQKDFHKLVRLGLQTRCWMGVPLLIKGQVIGVLTLSHSSPHFYTEQHLLRVQAYADEVALALQRAFLYEQAQASTVCQERQRLARELHDTVTQELYGIELNAQNARALIAYDTQQAQELLERVILLAHTGLVEARALLATLRPELIPEEALEDALHKQAAAMSTCYKLDVDLSLAAAPDITIEQKQVLLSIARESLQNVAKHAQVSEVRVRLQCDEHVITLEVRDNGRGFDSMQSFPGHLGLQTMRERTVKLGGDVTIESTPGQGTTIRACLPR